MAITRLNNNSLPTGSVLQVVSTETETTTSTTSQDSSFVDVTDLNASITPSSTSNKILIHVAIGKMGVATQYNADRFNNFRLVRGSTVIGIPSSSGDRTKASFGQTGGGYEVSGRGGESLSFTYLDTPSSVASLNYKVQYSGHAGDTTTINKSSEDNNNADAPHSRTISTITLTEIKG